MRKILLILAVLAPVFLYSQISIREVIVDGVTKVINVDECYAVVPQNDGTALLLRDRGRAIDIDDAYLVFVVNNCATFLEVHATNWNYPTGFNTVGINPKWIQDVDPVTGGGSKVRMLTPKASYTVTEAPTYFETAVIGDLCSTGGGGGGSGFLNYTLTSGSVSVDVTSYGDFNAVLTNPDTGEYLLSIPAGVQLHSATVYGNSTTLSPTQEFIFKIDYSVNSFDKRSVVQIYDSQNDQLVDQQVSGTVNDQSATANITTMTFPNMNGFGTSGFYIELR